VGDAAVPDLDVAAARAGALAEQQRRLRAMGRWIVVGLVVGGVGLVLGPVLFAVGFAIVVLALYTLGPYAFGARAAVLNELGRGELRVHPGTSTSRIEVRPERGPSFSGAVSGSRFQRWSPNDHDPVVLFGTPEKGGFVVAVSGRADGSTRSLGLQSIRPG
jgi:hypothetical protein